MGPIKTNRMGPATRVCSFMGRARSLICAKPPPNECRFKFVLRTSLSILPQPMTHGSTNGCFPTSVDALCIALPFALSKDILLNLAGRGLRQVLAFDCGWTLEVSHPRPAVLDNLFRGGLSARVCSHERLSDFPPLLIPHRNDR